jgi:hypothetical protein
LLSVKSMASRSLSSPDPVPPLLDEEATLYINLKPVLKSRSRKELWDRIGKRNWGALYEVRDKNGFCLEEFISF